tara:strand:+ start:4586 stop:5413 length:828 start_codon:yes stop_codon:yes gene_type:complete
MTSCLICGCVKNCEQYLDNVFKNIEKIQKLFIKSKILISFDISNDFSLKRLIELKKNFDIDIIINKDPLTNCRTVNIERARNKILNKIYNEYSDYEYFIMIDMDDVSAKPIYIESLIHGLNNHEEWDALFFNNQNYYDFWALCIDDFQYSLWHSNNPKLLINEMNRILKNKFNNINNNEFLHCESAFGGFGIYKTNCFSNCIYKSQIDISLFNPQNIQNICSKYKIGYIINNNVYDCEHRYFHLNAIKKNNVRLRISKKFLFPPYIGEHITHIRN